MIGMWTPTDPVAAAIRCRGAAATEADAPVGEVRDVVEVDGEGRGESAVVKGLRRDGMEGRGRRRRSWMLKWIIILAAVGSRMVERNSTMGLLLLRRRTSI